MSYKTLIALSIIMALGALIYSLWPTRSINAAEVAKVQVEQSRLELDRERLRADHELRLLMLAKITDNNTADPLMWLCVSLLAVFCGVSVLLLNLSDRCRHLETTVNHLTGTTDRLLLTTTRKEVV